MRPFIFNGVRVEDKITYYRLFLKDHPKYKDNPELLEVDLIKYKDKILSGGK